MSEAANPPVARRGGDPDDPYRWLEDGDSDEVKTWVDAHDAHARAWLRGLARRDGLHAQLTKLYAYAAVSPPRRRGERLFYTRKHANKDKNVVYWRPDGTSEDDERVLFDPNAMSPDGSVSLGVWVPSWDGTLVAWARRERAADAATLYVRDVASGEDLEVDVIDGCKYAHPSWLPDSTGFYYTRLPSDPSIDVADLPGHAAIRFHAIGDDPAGDRLVHPPTGSAKTFVHGGVSRDGRWLLVHISHGWNSTEVFLADREASDTAFAPLVEGVEANFAVMAWDGWLYVVTDEDAPKRRVLRVRAEAPARDDWEEIVPEHEHAVLEDATIAGGRLACAYLRDAHGALELRELDGTRVRDIPLPGLGSVGAVVGEPDDDVAYFAFSSFTEPTSIHRFSIAGTAAPRVWRRVTIDADTSRFVTDQVRYRSADGTEITMFLVRKDDVAPNGDNPTILSGYGGFSVSMTPAFYPQIVPWLEAGGVFAIPNLRGGGEYGEDWHRAGMGARKQNVFDDFLAAAEYLIDQRWTRPERLAIRGGSNGGLLVGAAMTQRPELFAAVVCAVPLLDMLRYHLHGSGKTWIPEYGDPEVAEQREHLAAYSPYHHVAEGTDYPALLLLSADGDDRVDPMHARKFAARVAHARAGDAPVLLRVERQAGHGGADLISRLVEQAADTYAFLFDRLVDRVAKG